MNHDHSRAAAGGADRSPFWICLLVFLALAVDAGVHCARLLHQRGQLQQLGLNQAATIGRLATVLTQSPQVEARLQSISLDLLRLARTNAAAAQLVREFNINYTPGKQTAAPAAVSGETNAAEAAPEARPATP